MGSVTDLSSQKPPGPPGSQRTRTALGITTALALSGIALTFLLLFTLFLLTGTAVVLAALIVGIVFTCIAGFIMTGLRWASVLGSLAALIVMIFLFRVPLAVFTLQHPTSDVARFSELVIICALAVIALITGIAATVQNYRYVDRHTPSWLGLLLVGMSGLAIGMISVTLLIATSHS